MEAKAVRHAREDPLGRRRRGCLAVERQRFECYLRLGAKASNFLYPGFALTFGKYLMHTTRNPRQPAETARRSVSMARSSNPAQVNRTSSEPSFWCGCGPEAQDAAKCRSHFIHAKNSHIYSCGG